MISDRPNDARVVITGMGVVTCLGSELGSFWEALLEGRSGIGPLTQFDPAEMPCKIAGEVRDFVTEGYIPAKTARRMSRASQMALVASIKAAEDAGLPAPVREPDRTGVYFGTAIGGWDRGVAGVKELWQNGLAKVNPFYLPSTLPNMPAFHVAHHFQALGPTSTISTACASGTQAIGEAALAIRSGRADIIFAGGTEAMIQPFTIGGFSIMRAVPMNYNSAPQKASRPFDAKREGFVFSEGAACLVLESRANALARGAKFYAEIGGFASSCDAYHLTSPDPEGLGPIRAMAWAMQDAGIGPEDVDYINAHGTSTIANDAIETLAIKRLFKDRAYEIAISSTKSMIGHAMGASGAIEAVVCALTIKNGWIHPTINYEHPDPDLDLDYVPNKARRQQVFWALSNSFGLGGQNASLAIRHPE